MDGFLKQSTVVNVKIGPFIDNTDGITALSALSITQSAVRLSKNAGANAQKNSASACTTDELGYYSCPLNAVDTNTLGLLQLMVSDATALAVKHCYMVVTANIYDTLCSTDTFDVNVTSQANIDFGALQKTSLSAATPALSTAGKAAVADAVWDELLSGHDTDDSAGESLQTIRKIKTNKRTVVGTTETIYEDNGSTVFKQWTLDSITAPTTKTPL